MPKQKLKPAAVPEVPPFHAALHRAVDAQLNLDFLQADLRLSKPGWRAAAERGTGRSWADIEAEAARLDALLPSGAFPQTARLLRVLSKLIGKAPPEAFIGAWPSPDRLSKIVRDAASEMPLAKLEPEMVMALVAHHALSRPGAQFGVIEDMDERTAEIETARAELDAALAQLATAWTATDVELAVLPNPHRPRDVITVPTFKLALHLSPHQGDAWPRDLVRYCITLSGEQSAPYPPARERTHQRRLEKLREVAARVKRNQHGVPHVGDAARLLRGGYDAARQIAEQPRTGALYLGGISPD